MTVRHAPGLYGGRKGSRCCARTPSASGSTTCVPRRRRRRPAHRCRGDDGAPPRECHGRRAHRQGGQPLWDEQFHLGEDPHARIVHGQSGRQQKRLGRQVREATRRRGVRQVAREWAIVRAGVRDHARRATVVATVDAATSRLDEVRIDAAQGFPARTAPMLGRCGSLGRGGCLRRIRSQASRGPTHPAGLDARARHRHGSGSPSASP